MNILIPTIVFILGASIGSFLSVVMERLKKKRKGIFWGRSYCPSCKHTLNPKDLFPIINYLYLKGKCAYCKKGIAGFYPMIEICTSIAFLGIYFHFTPLFFSGNTLQILGTLSNLVIHLIYAAILILVFFYDIKYMEIPDKIMLPGILLALIGSMLPQTPQLIDALLGALIPTLFFGLQIMVSKGRWMGGGDLRIGAFMGLILGWKGVILALILSYLIGSITAAILLISKKVKLQSQVPFAPFLVIATFISLLFQEKIIEWYFTISWL